MTWIEGAPLRDFIDVFPLLADDQQERSAEALAIRWLLVMADALGVFHRNGLVHGDVSPRNMIVSGTDLVLTDYD
jgi:tRNA A-37 threonylcarbamoyl transferase component Bud32